MSPTERPALSVIVPVGARHADLSVLYRQYQASLATLGSCEFIFVLDGPCPAVRRALEELQQGGAALTIVNLTRRFGEAAALMAGLERAQGTTLLTLPAYHQIEPADIPLLVAALEHADMAIACREPRRAHFFDRLRRATFHGLLNLVTGAHLRDLGCGARAMRREVLEEMDLYGDQHRFMAVLALHLGFRVSEVGLRQSALDRTARVYRPREYIHHLLDLFSILFLVRFTKKPLRFFGMLGAGTFTLGCLLIGWLAGERLLLDEPLADRPALLLAALLVVLGLQVFALGLLGELIIFTHANALKDYRIERIIHYPQAQPDSTAAPACGSDSNPASAAARTDAPRPATQPAVTA